MVVQTARVFCATLLSVGTLVAASHTVAQEIGSVYYVAKIVVQDGNVYVVGQTYSNDPGVDAMYFGVNTIHAKLNGASGPGGWTTDGPWVQGNINVLWTVASYDSRSCDEGVYQIYGGHKINGSYYYDETYFLWDVNDCGVDIVEGTGGPA
jgi:hypothetical protein